MFQPFPDHTIQLIQLLYLDPLPVGRIGNHHYGRRLLSPFSFMLLSDSLRELTRSKPLAKSLWCFS
jgi:hypothetical protein